MQILKHIKNGRLFVATPALLKSKNMAPAPADEAQAFISSMDESQREKIESAKSTQEADVMLPDDLDPKVNITNFGKPQLLQLAQKINLSIPVTLKVKDIRPLIQDKLDKLAESMPEEPALKKVSAK